MLAKYAERHKKASPEYTAATDLPYMGHVIRMLEMGGSWPFRRLGLKRQLPKLPYKIFFFLYNIGFSTSTSYVVKHSHEMGFIELGHSYITILMNIIIIQRMSMSWFPSFHKTLIKFVRHIHLFHFRNQSEYHTKMYDELHVILHYFVIIMVVQGVLAGNAFALMPAYFNYAYGMYGSNRPANMTFDNSVFYDLPFDYLNDLGGHLVVLGINIVLVCHSAFCYVTYDVLLCVIVFNLWGHVRILKQRLGTFPPPANSDSPDETPFYNEEEMKIVNRRLIDIIKYHKIIRDYNNEAEDAFGFMMCVYSLFHQVCLCILLLKCAQNNIADTIRYGLILIYMIQQLVIISVIFELLSSESDTIKDAIYGVPWECMDTKNRRIVHIFLFVSQKNMEFKAMGMVRIGVQSMSAILRTTFSYFMLLKTFQS